MMMAEVRASCSACLRAREPQELELCESFSFERPPARLSLFIYPPAISSQQQPARRQVGTRACLPFHLPNFTTPLLTCFTSLYYTEKLHSGETSNLLDRTPTMAHLDRPRSCRCMSD